LAARVAVDHLALERRETSDPFGCDLSMLDLWHPFPKIAAARSDNPYGVQMLASARGEQHRAGACTPFAAIADFRIEYSVIPQFSISLSPFAYP
jgi:hypothetical protein